MARIIGAFMGGWTAGRREREWVKRGIYRNLHLTNMKKSPSRERPGYDNSSRFDLSHPRLVTFAATAFLGVLLFDVSEALGNAADDDGSAAAAGGLDELTISLGDQFSVE
jgi:hypothetical protein